MQIYNKVSSVLLATSFTLGLISPIVALAAGPATINLLSASNFAVLAKTGISSTGNTLVTGDIGVSPAEATYITGFGLNLSAASAFATSPLVVGKVYAPGYAAPTPANITTSVSAMQAAYVDGAGRTNPTATELGAGNIGGMTLAPGLYKWSTGVTIPTDVTLSGSANDVWIFQIAQNLNISSAKKVILSGGAQASNIFWIVAGQTTIGTTAVFNGNILDQTAIVLNTGAKLNGRALAQAAVTLDASSVTIPSSASVTYTPTSNPTPAPVSSYSNTGNYSYSGTVTTNVPSSNTTMPSVSVFGQQVRTIAISLGQGGRGSNVTILQQFLISQNKGLSAQALARVGATGYFGGMTRAALAEFQANVGISPALGNFGPITRAYLSAHY